MLFFFCFQSYMRVQSHNNNLQTLSLKWIYHFPSMITVSCAYKLDSCCNGICFKRILVIPRICLAPTVKQMLENQYNCSCNKQHYCWDLFVLSVYTICIFSSVEKKFLQKLEGFLLHCCLTFFLYFFPVEGLAKGYYLTFIYQHYGTLNFPCNINFCYNNQSLRVYMYKTITRLWNLRTHM